MVEIDADTGEIVWSYRARLPLQFYSPIAGTCQRLANGNTLITQSTGGRVFEVTPDGEIVWDFLSPYRAGERDRLVAFLPDMQRVQVDWLEESR